MAVPKNRLSQTRQKRRRANWKLTAQDSWNVRNVMKQLCLIMCAPLAGSTKESKL